MKIWRPFWSYRLDTTEKWLQAKAEQGFLLHKVSRATSVFTFQQMESQQAVFVADYKNQQHTERLQQAGWQTICEVGNWAFRKAENPTLFPSGEQAFKRFRKHFWIAIILFTLLLPSMTVIGMASITSFINQTDYELGFTAGIVSALCVMTFYGLAFWFYQKQERKFFHMKPVQKAIGKHHRIRLAWFYEPYQTKKWLEKKLEQGYELERVVGSCFTFKERTSEHVTYEISYAKAISPQYIEMLEDMGWQNKYRSGASFMNYMIWAMPYTEGEEIPQLTYNIGERRKMMKKRFLFSNSISVLFMLFSLWNILWMTGRGESFFDFSVKLHSVFAVLWGIILSRAIWGFVMEMRELRQHKKV